MKSVVLAACVAAVALLFAPEGGASPSQQTVLPSVLLITKSSNRNQVAYAETVDESCAPVGPSPVRPYWRMLEKGPGATEGLTSQEERALGLQRQQIAGDTVQVALRAMPDRQFGIHVARAADGRCSSYVTTTIAGVPARLEGIFVQQKLFGSVDYVQLTGTAEGGSVVRERVSM